MIVMIFVLGKALLSLLFYTDNPYFLTTFSKFLFLLFPYFFVEGHLKARNSYFKLALDDDIGYFNVSKKPFGLQRH